MTESGNVLRTTKHTLKVSSDELGYSNIHVKLYTLSLNYTDVSPLHRYLIFFKSQRFFQKTASNLFYVSKPVGRNPTIPHNEYSLKNHLTTHSATRNSFPTLARPPFPAPLLTRCCYCTWSWQSTRSLLPIVLHVSNTEFLWNLKIFKTYHIYTCIIKFHV